MMGQSTFSFSVSLVHFISGEGRIPKLAQWAIWLCIALLVAKMSALFGLLTPFGLMGLLIGIPIVLLMVCKVEAGIYLMLLMAFFISIPNRLLEGVPMGILIDASILLMLVGVLYRSAYHKDWNGFSTPVSIVILIWIAINFLEVANPIAASRQAWFFVIRPAVGYILLFFLTYAALRTPKKMFRLILAILALSLFSACWGIWQATVGYFEWEYNYVLRHELMHLVFNYGRWRAIGTIGSPSQFGIIMAFISIFSISLLPAYSGRLTKFFIIVVSACAILAMVYSGTRSAYIIIPIAYLFYILISGNRKLYYSLIVFGSLLVTVAVVPSNNYHIQRIQSTFKGSNDASYQTRARNREMILPWILKHPIGGGLGSTGVWGQRFSPGTFLANFPPDSGLVRVAVELGWVGLLIFLNLYFNIIAKGIFSAKVMANKKYKSVVIGLVSAIAPLLVVEWGQEVIGVFPMSILFWILTAVMFRAAYFDRTERNAKNITS